MTTPQLLFEKFEIASCLKQDDFSAVYLARHTFLERQIILKVLNTQTMRDAVVLERFKREARILARLEHPNIIKVIDFGMHELHFYISFEYFESRNLRQIFGEKELLPEERRAILSELLEALQYAHKAGIIHRDIKPENILIGSDHRVKLSDFGLAEMNTDSLVTDKFGLVGTPGYMSPEQIRGEKLTLKSDLFACGIVACELFIGVHPFLGRDINESLNAIVSFDEETLLEKIAPLPPDLRNVVFGLLRKKTVDRWHDAGAALDELGLVAGAAPSLGLRAAGFLATPSRLRMAISIAVLLVATTGYIVIRTGRPTDPNATRINEAQQSLSQGGQGEQGSGGHDSVKQTPAANVVPPLSKPADSGVQLKGNALADNMLKPNNGRNAIPNPTLSSSTKEFGELYIECLPWGRVSVDSVDLETTPLKRNLRLRAGTHQVELVHPKYPIFSTTVSIQANQVSTIRVNLDTLFGYLGCEASPWGEVYVDGSFLDRTPIRPVRLIPGRHHITLKNKAFANLEQDVMISRNDTAWVKHHFSAVK